MQACTPDTFLTLSYPLLDARSPGEYAEAHIPGAISFPLFDDAERAEVGTLYKQSGQKDAIKRGLEFVGPKMRPLIEAAEKLKSKNLRVHCWRGGMRSQSLAWLLDTYGFEVHLLTGGYKAYRQAMLELYGSPLQLRVLSGFTGTKKTLILHALKRMGEQTIDLEGAAGHQGSSFGNVLSQGQPTTEHFHNLLYEEARVLDPTRPIWIEDESMMIGACAMPRELYLRKQSAPHHIIQLPMEVRLQHLVGDYGDVPAAGLVKATEGIRKKLGHERADEAIALIGEGNHHEAARIILDYYDRMYQRSIDKKTDAVKEIHDYAHGDVDEIAKDLINGN